MKKYNLSEIMKKAWRVYKNYKNLVHPLSFSECLKRAWEEAKKALEKPAEITLNAVKAAAQKLTECGSYESVSYKEWNGHDKNRLYIKAYRHTLAGNLRVAECGYWDFDSSKYISGANDIFSL